MTRLTKIIEIDVAVPECALCQKMAAAELILESEFPYRDQLRTKIDTKGWRELHLDQDHLLWFCGDCWGGALDKIQSIFEKKMGCR